MPHGYKDSSDLIKTLPVDKQPDRRFVVIYDGACYFCTFSVTFTRRLDFLNKFSYVTLQEFSRMDGVKIPYSVLQESIHLIDRVNGKTWNSTSALGQILLRIPPAFPFLILLAFLKLIHVAEPAYQWLAKSRYFLSSVLKG